MAVLQKLIEQWVALYVRLSRDDENEGDSNSIAHQELLYRGWFHHLLYMTAVHLWQNGICSCEKGGGNAKSKCFCNCG